MDEIDPNQKTESGCIGDQPPPSKGRTDKGAAEEIVEGGLDSQHFAPKVEGGDKLTENRQAQR